MQKATMQSPGSPRRSVFLLALVFLLPMASAQTPMQPARMPAKKLYMQRGKIKSLSPKEIVLEAVDTPSTTFLLTPTTENGSLKLGELVQITFTMSGDLKIAHTIAEIVATPIRLPRGATGRTLRAETPLGTPRATTSSKPPGTSTAVNLPQGTVRQDGASISDVDMPTGAGHPAPISAAPISLAADESQLIHMRAPEIHQSGVSNPIRLAILDFQPESAADVSPSRISDRLESLLHNDGLFSLLDRSKFPSPFPTELSDPKAILELAQTLDHPDAILVGEIKEEIPDHGQSDGSRRHRIQAVFPTIVLEGRLYDAHTGKLLGTPKGMGGGSQDRADDRTSPILRAVRDAVESLAASIDPEYPSLLDPRTFATVVSVEPNRMTVAFPGRPSVQAGNHLQIGHPNWFTRDPATGNITAVSTEPLGTFIVTTLERSEASGTYQGTAPAPGQTIRLSR